MTCKEYAVGYHNRTTITNTAAKKSLVNELNRKYTSTPLASEMNAPQFWCNQVTGTVAPLSQQTVEVYFAPHKTGEMSATLHFRFVKNTTGKGIDVKCTGVGKRINV